MKTDQESNRENIDPNSDQIVFMFQIKTYNQDSGRYTLPT